MAYDQSFTGIFPWTEDLPSNPEGTASYGGFKAVAEQAMLDRHAASGFPASVVRPAAIYGPDNNIFDMEAPMFLRLLQSRPILVPHGGLVARLLRPRRRPVRASWSPWPASRRRGARSSTSPPRA